MARTGRNGNVAIKKETTYGTYVAGDIYTRVSSESLNREITHVEDPALVGSIYTTEMIKTGEQVSGGFETTLHPDTAGIYMHAVLGGESAVTDPNDAYLVISFNGSDSYARLTNSSDVLTAETSTNGSSWAADTNFNATGSIDLSDASFDTFTELQAAIDGYTGWSATLFGNTTATSTNIADFSATNLKADGVKVGAMLLQSGVSGSTVAKTHNLTPAGSTASLPSYSVTIARQLGTDESLGFVGCKLSSMGINAEANGLVSSSLTWNGQKEETGKTDLSLTLPSSQGYTSANMTILAIDPDGNQIDMDEVNSFNATLNANLDEARVIGSLYKKEPVRQSSTLEVSFSANNTSTQYALRDDFISDSAIELFVYMKSADEADTSNSIPYSSLIRFPALKLTNFNSPLSTPDRLVIEGAGTVEKPQNSVYTSHIYVYTVDTDTTTY